MLQLASETHFPLAGVDIVQRPPEHSWVIQSVLLVQVAPTGAPIHLPVAEQVLEVQSRATLQKPPIADTAHAPFVHTCVLQSLSIKQLSLAFAKAHFPLWQLLEMQLAPLVHVPLVLVRHLPSKQASCEAVQVVAQVGKAGFLQYPAAHTRPFLQSVVSTQWPPKPAS
ncbi:MAG: hypothetical protein V4534_07735 [Myxococcota bacterium]